MLICFGRTFADGGILPIPLQPAKIGFYKKALGDFQRRFSSRLENGISYFHLQSAECEVVEPSRVCFVLDVFL